MPPDLLQKLWNLPSSLPPRQWLCLNHSLVLNWVFECYFLYFHHNRALNQSEHVKRVTCCHTYWIIFEVIVNEEEKLEVLGFGARDAEDLGQQERINGFAFSRRRWQSFHFLQEQQHVQMSAVSVHFRVILIAMVNLAVIAELCNTTEISDISIWHYKKIW